MWISDDCGLGDGGVFGEDVLDLGRAQPVTAHVDHVVHATRDLQKSRLFSDIQPSHLIVFGKTSEYPFKFMSKMGSVHYHDYGFRRIY